MELTLNPGTNPKINPLDVTRVYNECLADCEYWSSYKQYINVTLLLHIEPMARKHSYPTLALAQEVQKVCAKNFGSVEKMYKKNRASFTKRIFCAVFHKKAHERVMQHVGADGFYFRKCIKCTVVKQEGQNG